MDPSNLYKSFIEFKKYFPPGYMEVEDRNDMITFYIGDVDFSIDRDTGIMAGSGTKINAAKEWTTPEKI